MTQPHFCLSPIVDAEKSTACVELAVVLDADRLDAQQELPDKVCCLAYFQGVQVAN